jgi:hypothetical protein
LKNRLHFGFPNHELSFKLFFFFLVWTNWFPSKMIPCKLNLNLICLGHVLLSKGLGTKLKLLTNRNDQFHWTLLLVPLSKVGLSKVHFHVFYSPIQPQLIWSNDDKRVSMFTSVFLTTLWKNPHMAVEGVNNHQLEQVDFELRWLTFVSLKEISISGEGGGGVHWIVDSVSQHFSKIIYIFALN